MIVKDGKEKEFSFLGKLSRIVKLCSSPIPRLVSVIYSLKKMATITNSGTTNSIIFNNIKAKVIKLSFIKISNITYPVYF